MKVKREVYYVLALVLIIFVIMFAFGKNIGLSPKETKEGDSSSNSLREVIISSFNLGSLDQSKRSKDINVLTDYLKQFSASVPAEEDRDTPADSSSGEVEFSNEIFYDERGLPKTRVITGDGK